MIRLGLIGEKLSHSFSKNFFEEKWQNENISGYSYELFELKSIDEFHRIMEKGLSGLNVTVPYKESILPFLTHKDESVSKIGAANVIKFERNGDIVGYNSDYYGFKKSLENWLPSGIKSSLVLGTGGASKAVEAVLKDLGIQVQLVSRSPRGQAIGYEKLSTLDLGLFPLIVNASPLGMFPNSETYPPIPYSKLSENNFTYDLVYNPAVTKFISLANKNGASGKNGLEMLTLQAEKSWEIWTS